MLDVDVDVDGDLDVDEASAVADTAAPATRVVTLAGETDFDGFRRAARGLVADGVDPDAVQWAVARSDAPELFAQPADSPALPPLPPAGEGWGKGGAAPEPNSADARTPALAPALSRGEREPAADPPAPPAAATAVRVPAEFVTLCRHVVLHQDRRRFDLLYRLLWRLQHEPGLRHDALDAQIAQARLMAQAVRRDMHKMKAFVRFREVARGEAGDGDGSGSNGVGTNGSGSGSNGGGARSSGSGSSDSSSGNDSSNIDDKSPLHVAWFEPQHHIVEATAPFFMRRFADMPWAILTPERCVRWDGRQLEFSPGANRQDAPPADAGEALWLTYYRHIFNPARLKLRMMEKEMPRRYWHNLPEAELISGLAADAHARSGGMLAREAVAPVRKLGAAPARARTLPPLVMAQPDNVHPNNVHPNTMPSALADLPGTAEGRQAAWTAQRDAASRCRECPLGALATQTVWGEGPVTAKLMLVGEQPGDQEDLQGKPFVGPAGQLLNRAIAQLDWDRSIAYVTNAVKHFKYEPRGKRRVHKTPAQREADACQHWLESEIALVQPKALVALGATAARQLLGRPVAVTRERGQWLQRADGLQVLITLHPSALLRAEPADREAGYAAWLADLRLADPYARSALGSAG